MDTAAVPASVAITKMIIDALPILIPLLFVGLGGLILQVRSAAAAAARTAEEAKETAKLDAKAVDGQMTDFKLKLAELSDLKIQVATLTATAAGKDKGAAEQQLAALQHDQLALAKALPPTDAKIVNGGKVQSDQQADRIEKTGDDTNSRVQKVETNTDKRVADVEAKIDSKEDKQ